MISTSAHTSYYARVGEDGDIVELIRRKPSGRTGKGEVASGDLYNSDIEVGKEGERSVGLV